MNDFFKTTFFGNTIEDFCWFAGIIIVGLIFQRLLSKLLTLFVYKVFQKYTLEVGFDHLLALLRKPMGILIMLISFYIASTHLEFPPEWNIESIEKFGLRLFIYRTYQVLIVLSVTWIFLRVIDFFGVVFMHRASLTESKMDDQLVPFLKETVKVVISILAFFFILGAVFKVNVASLIAGLGIGGLAIALAAKESLENLLGSFTIFFDKPFLIGDLIKVGNIEGKVENIGFRSTRIRTADKSFVTVPNKKLIDNELDNFSLRTQRRVTFNIGISYETKVNQLKNIASEIQQFIETHPQVAKGETQVRMFGFDVNSINIMVLYFIATIDYTTYLTVREEINYKIMETVEKNGSGFAHLTPSNTGLANK